MRCTDCGACVDHCLFHARTMAEGALHLDRTDGMQGGSDYRELADAPNLWMALSARNFSVRRERLAEAGGWDAEIETPSVLETDVAMRLRDGGCRCRYEPRAVAMRQDAPPQQWHGRLAAREEGLMRGGQLGIPGATGMFDSKGRR